MGLPDGPLLGCGALVCCCGGLPPLPLLAGGIEVGMLMGMGADTGAWTSSCGFLRWNMGCCSFCTAALRAASAAAAAAAILSALLLLPGAGRSLPPPPPLLPPPPIALPSPGMSLPYGPPC